MYLIYSFLSVFLVLTSCSDNNNNNNNSDQAITIENTTSLKASIVSVTPSGESGDYTFSVGISSPDTGCSQYANWWEVITEEGELVYRRILGHSHVNEQPFVRSGGAVSINANQVVIIRAHMNTSGYGTDVFKGSVFEGFAKDTVEADFGNGLDLQQPLPSNCAF